MSDPQTTETAEPKNIIVNDFDAIKRRIWREIGGHRSDLIIAALRSVLDEVIWDTQKACLPQIHKQLTENATNDQA